MVSKTRRDFIKAAAAGSIAAGGMRAYGMDDPSVFPDRGIVERLVLSFAHVHIGLESPFSVLHVSDTHLTASCGDDPAETQAFATLRRKTFGGRQEEALADSVAWAEKNCDAIVHTGDLIDFQSAENMKLARRFYSSPLKKIGCTGNHEYWRRPSDYDTSEEHKAASASLLSDAYGFDSSFHSTILGGVNFVSMENVHGTVTEDQAAKFEKETEKGLPIVLCVHVPFATDDIFRATYRYWMLPSRPYRQSELPKRDELPDYERAGKSKATVDFIKRLKSEPLLKCILAGHEHLAVEDRFSPTAMEYLAGGNFMFHGREVLFT